MTASFVFVSGNRNKVAESERIIGRSMESAAVDLPEIQSLDLAEVLEAKVKEAWRRLERTVVVEETGLELAGMNGFPGPLVKWMLDAVGAEGVARTAHGLDDPGATAICALAWYDGERLLIGRGETRGQLILEPRGNDGFGWDPVFVPEGRRRSYAELGARGKDLIGHRGRAWRDFLSVLSEHGIEV